MSRCFPFPPPGYVNKARPVNDYLNSIAKKDKEKKHKEKKDKDTKERSGRKDKDKERTEGKHKDDKDRKQKKHRDKKDKDKKRDKHKPSEEKKVVGTLENQNGEKPGPDDKPVQGDCASSFGISTETGKRVRNDDGQRDKKKPKHESSEEKKIDGPYAEKPGPDKNGTNGFRVLVETGKEVRNHDVETDKKKDKRIVGPSEIQNGEKSGPDGKPINRVNGFRISAETGKIVENDDGGTEKKKGTKIVGAPENQKAGPVNKPGNGANDCRISVEAGKRVRNDNGLTDIEKKIVGPSENQYGEKPSLDNKPGGGVHNDRFLVEMGKRVRNDDGATGNSHDASMANRHSLGVDAKCSGNNSGEKRIKEDNGFCQANTVEKKREGKEKKKNRDKSKKEEKKRKKEEKKLKKEKVKQRASEVNLLDFCTNKPEDLLKESWDKQGKLPNLKDPMLNGVLHENGKGPDIMSRPAISSRQLVQNGNDTHPSHKNTILPLAVEKQAVITNPRINGTKLAPPQAVIKKVRDTDPAPTAKISTPEHVRSHIDNHAISNGFIPSHPPVLKNVRDTKPEHVRARIDNHAISNGFIPSHPPAIKNERDTKPVPSANISTPEHVRARIENHAISNGFIPSHPPAIKNERDTKPVPSANISTPEHVRSSIDNHAVSSGFIPSHPPVIKNVRDTKPVPTENISTPEHVRACKDSHAVSNGFIPSHPLVENGRKMARSDHTDKTVNRPRPVLEGKKDISSRPPSASAKPKEKTRTIKKAPPHPDLKYLSQILTVPKLESPPFDDDQEWLFGCKDTKRPKFGSSVVESTDRVWAEAIRLESADIIALPYVIPY